ncbi:MAG TPA: cytochrome b/b6 domain-containing protein [Ramlibacter sp.]|uniref:cytochrome b/b6 domain-containing protein n=1 Tax=Ramlibacter sp. TaxID=1917967 RepID=UPI002CD61D1D|nr:cytochrome b/b6 domain-containing protein [Ramlibacter sp.]HVZ46773.1 cytochrome b/b6 domain-containing protein [Ramlibacter sp.]
MPAVRIWDLPTRVFHWLLAACVLGLFVTGYTGGDAMDWHARFGWAAGCLLIFRVAWGFLGGRWSRFASFVPTPGSVLRYLQSRDDRAAIGHNPLGAISVLAMLAVLLVQVATGLFSTTLEDFAGPLNVLVSNSTGKAITRYHRNIGQILIIALVILHIAAIAYYRWRRQLDLVGPMVNGDKQLAADVPASRDDAWRRVLGLGVFVACAALMSWIWTLGSH